MSEQQKPGQQSTEKPGMSIQDLDFRLEDVPLSPPKAPVELPKDYLTGRDRKRTMEKLAADLKYADADRDKRLSAEELRSIEFTALPNTTVPFATGTLSVITQLAEQYSKDQKTNSELMFPKSETGLQQAPFLSVVPTTDAVVPDHVLMSRELLKKDLAAKLNLDPTDVEKVLRKSLPKGVEEVRLSGECAHYDNEFCTAEPIGKVRFSILPKERI